MRNKKQKGIHRQLPFNELAKKLQTSVPDQNLVLCPYLGPSSCYKAITHRYSLWRSVLLKKRECGCWRTINVLHQYNLGLHCCYGQQYKEKGVIRFGFFRGLLPWLVDSHLFAVSSHDLFCVHFWCLLLCPNFLFL